MKFKHIKIILLATLSFMSVASATEERFFGDIIDYGENYLSPEFIASHDGKTILVGCKTGDKVLTIKNDKVSSSLDLGARVSGLCVAKDGTAYATLFGENGKLVKIKTSPKLEKQAECIVGNFQNAPVVSADVKFVYLANQFTNVVRKLDSETGKELAKGKAVHEPVAMQLTPDGKELLVVNHLPEPKCGL